MAGTVCFGSSDIVSTVDSFLNWSERLLLSLVNTATATTTRTARDAFSSQFDAITSTKHPLNFATDAVHARDLMRTRHPLLTAVFVHLRQCLINTEVITRPAASSTVSALKLLSYPRLLDGRRFHGYSVVRSYTSQPRRQWILAIRDATGFTVGTVGTDNKITSYTAKKAAVIKQMLRAVSVAAGSRPDGADIQFGAIVAWRGMSLRNRGLNE